MPVHKDEQRGTWYFKCNYCDWQYELAPEDRIFPITDRAVQKKMKRDRYGGADWVETQKAVLQEMMLKEFGWERFYKGSNPRENLTLSDYRREKAAEMAKEEERKLEDIKDKVTAGHATIQAQAEQMEAILESLDKGAEAER